MRKNRFAVIALAGIMAIQCNFSAFAVPDASVEPEMMGTVETSNTSSAGSSLVKTGCVPASLSNPPEIVGEAGIVVDMATGYTLYEKNIQTQHYPASITKIMTATLALENLKMEDVVTFSHDAVFSIEPGSSSAYADEGEQLTVEQCLYGLMLISGNDLANGLAEAVSGSMDAFAEKMTEKARELGCIGTQFKNAHGLHDEGHYTTAYDMAIIAINAYTNFEMFQTLCSTVRYDVPPTNICNETRYWLNNNRMIREGEEYYYESCIGGKTGYTDQAGGTLVTFADLNGRKVVCVILKSTNSASAYADSIALYDYIKGYVTPEDYAVLDAKAAEDESLAVAAQESVNPQETESATKKTEKKVEEKEQKSSSFIWKFFALIIILLLVMYGYVQIKRYQARQRKIERRRQVRMEEEGRLRRQRQIEQDLADRKKKYRNYDFKK
ncbi:MAG: D-alanyl-D-alanine carboxypeptidase [Lachnospiraceae bacterium]|nr:D-alanyl-D-alanine carboxypeptidase [Lachnospiraceae bacterium]